MTPDAAADLLDLAYGTLKVSSSQRRQAAHHLHQLADLIEIPGELADELRVVAKVLDVQWATVWDTQFGGGQRCRQHPAIVRKADPIPSDTDTSRLMLAILRELAAPIAMADADA